MRILPVVLVSLLAAPASAQIPATISGRLVPGTYCGGTQGNVVEHTIVGNAFVTAVDLSGLGQNITIEGTMNIATNCAFMLASGAKNNPFQLFVCNAPAIGCEVSIDMCPSPTNGSFILFGSFGTSVIPLAPETGTFLLDPNQMFTLTAGPKGPVCEAVHLIIPFVPAAVGLEAYFQAAHVPPTGAPLLSNLAKMTIQPPIPGCQYLECF